MKAFDTDILTEIFRGNSEYVEKAALIPVAEQAVSVVVAEEVLRGRLNIVRQAQTGKAKVAIDQAYTSFEQTLNDLLSVNILSYTPHAESLVQSWRKQKIRIGISDMRIAATCIVHAASLISRNRRDFEQIPGLAVEFWD